MNTNKLTVTNNTSDAATVLVKLGSAVWKGDLELRRDDDSRGHDGHTVT